MIFTFEHGLFHRYYISFLTFPAKLSYKMVSYIREYVYCTRILIFCNYNLGVWSAHWRTSCSCLLGKLWQSTGRQKFFLRLHTSGRIILGRCVELLWIPLSSFQCTWRGSCIGWIRRECYQFLGPTPLSSRYLRFHFKQLLQWRTLNSLNLLIDRQVIVGEKTVMISFLLENFSFLGW